MKALLLFLGLALGIVLGFFPNLALFLVCCVLACLLSTFSFLKKQPLFFLLPLGLGILLGLSHLIPYPEGHRSYTGIVICSKENYFILQTLQGRYYCSYPSCPYQFGDIVKANGYGKAVAFTTYESRFDFGQYLRDYGAKDEIAYANYVDVFCFPLRLSTLRNRFLNSLDSNAKALYSSLLFNRKDYQNDAILKADSLQVLSLLSASGILFSFFLQRAKTFLGYLLKDKTRDIAILAIATCFLPLAVTKVGILRVYIALWVRFINEHHMKKAWNGLEVLCLSGTALLLLDYHYLFRDGFFLGYFISFCLFIVNKWMKEKKKIKMHLVRLLVVRIALLPYLLKNSGGIAIFSFLYSELLFPFIVLFVFFGLIGFLVWPWPAFLNGYASVIKTMLDAFSSFNPTFPLPELSTVAFSLYFVLFFVCLFLTEIHHLRPRNGIIFVSIAFYCISLFPIWNYPFQSITFINVGQGDCALIQDGDKTMMIDTGGVLSFDLAKESLVPYLRKRRIYHIDVLIASHSDFDHIGAKDSLMSRFNVKRFIEDKSDFPLRLGSMDIQNHNIYEAKDENGTSLVLSLTLCGKRFLFTGDAPIEIEAKIIQDFPNLRADILKVGHHGSKTSTSDAFLSLLKPQEAIVSCGAKNSYGHPNKEVLERLNAHHVTIRRTDIEGSIVYGSIKPWA